jgi:hypothetical protein
MCWGSTACCCCCCCRLALCTVLPMMCDVKCAPTADFLRLLLLLSLRSSLPLLQGSLLQHWLPMRSEFPFCRYDATRVLRSPLRDLGAAASLDMDTSALCPLFDFLPAPEYPPIFLCSAPFRCECRLRMSNPSHFSHFLKCQDAPSPPILKAVRGHRHHRLHPAAAGQE